MNRPGSESETPPPGSRGSRSGALDFRSLLGDFQKRLDAELDNLLSTQVDDAALIGDTTREFTEPLRDFVARGGKRLRPALVHFAGRAAGRSESSLDVEMAVELLHTYLLIHDDIMDRAETRRGGPSAHRLFEADHHARGWFGDAGRWGEAVAILLGDLAHTLAVRLFLARGTSTRAAECFGEMCNEVIIGQYLEMTAPQRQQLEREDLLTILRLKSGRYSIERPIQLGVLLAEGSDALLLGLSKYGQAMGEAFQLQDDLLGVFGDSDEVGKPVGGDLAEGKFTVLVSVALERARETDRRAILDCLREPDAAEREIDRVRRIIEDVGARAEVEAMVADRLQLSAAELGELDLQGEGGVFFGGLIDYLRERKS